MDTLNRQMADLSVGQKIKGGSFMEILGSNIDSSYDKPITVDVVQDTFHISAGGQTIGPNANIQIQIDEQDCCHYLHKYGIAADLVCTNASLDNAVALFSGLEMQIGQVTWSNAFQEFYAQQKLARMGKEALKYVDRGVLLKHSDFAVVPNAAYTLFSPSAIGANTAMEVLQAYVRQMKAHYSQHFEYNGSNRVKIFVPLAFIFPALLELADDGALPLILGQKIKFNIKTTQASACLSSSGVGAPNYSMQNVSLVRCFSKLDPIRSDLIMKTVIPLPQLKYIHWQQQITTSVINSVFAISSKDRVKGLHFAFHTNVGCGQADDTTAVAARLLTASESQYKAPLNYFPQMPIQQIQVNVNGHVYNINMTQLQLLHTTDLLADKPQTYNYPIQRQLKHAYFIDMTRFGFNEDLFGSSSKNVGSIQVQITLVTGTRTLSEQPADWDATAFAQFGFYSYLECQQMFECRNGLYVQA